MESFDPVTRQGLDISNLFGLELAISAVLFALVMGWLVVALVRFRARADDPAQPPQTHGNRAPGDHLDRGAGADPGGRLRAGGADDAQRRSG